jgi:hypothetical protein
MSAPGAQVRAAYMYTLHAGPCGRLFFHSRLLDSRVHRTLCLCGHLCILLTQVYICPAFSFLGFGCLSPARCYSEQLIGGS